MSTQWRWTGGMEPVRAGLEYGALPVVLAMQKIRKKDHPAIFDGLRSMECAALNAWNEQSKNSKNP